MGTCDYLILHYTFFGYSMLLILFKDVHNILKLLFHKNTCYFDKKNIKFFLIFLNNTTLNVLCSGIYVLITKKKYSIEYPNTHYFHNCNAYEYALYWLNKVLLTNLFIIILFYFKILLLNINNLKSATNKNNTKSSELRQFKRNVCKLLKIDWAAQQHKPVAKVGAKNKWQRIKI